MLLKVSLIFCIIFAAWTSESRAGRDTTPEERRSAYINLDPEVRLFPLKFGNARSHAFYSGPDEKIKQYGYDELTESTNIAALGSFQIDIGNSTHRSTSRICLYSEKSMNNEKLYEGHFCASHLYATGEEAKAHIKATLVIPREGVSALQIHFHNIQHDESREVVLAQTKLTGFAISNKPGDFECTGKTSECDWDI